MDEDKSPPKGLYAVWADPKTMINDYGLLRNGRWLTDKALSYEEAIKLADEMNRANKEWHYYAKPLFNMKEITSISK